MLTWLREGARCEWTHGPPPPYHHGVSLAQPGDLNEQQSAFLEKEGYSLCVIGLPKTIDNDVYPITQSLGAWTAPDEGAEHFASSALSLASSWAAPFFS